MIYQLVIYFGALTTMNGVDDIAIYSMGYVLDDCRSLIPDKEFFEKLHVALEAEMRRRIELDGIDAGSFWYDYITKEQYENSLKNTNSECIYSYDEDCCNNKDNLFQNNHTDENGTKYGVSCKKCGKFFPNIIKEDLYD
jgi:hypothetical protein